MKTLKKISLTSVDKHDTLSDKAMKNVMGGYDTMWVTCTWADGTTESGLCGSTDPAQCKVWCENKYKYFGPLIIFDYEDLM